MYVPFTNETCEASILNEWKYLSSDFTAVSEQAKLQSNGPSHDAIEKLNA